jgi:hypothetical protein
MSRTIFMKIKRTIQGNLFLAGNVSVTSGVPVAGTGVAPQRKLAAAHLKMDRAMDTLEKTGFSTSADGSTSNDPLRKISEGSLPRSNRPT